MIVLDTNVVSVLMDERPDAAVMAWLDRQPWESVWTTSVTVFEIRTGLELLPNGGKRQRLETAFDRVLDKGLQHRVLPFDETAASVAGGLAAKQRRAGRPAEVRDIQIAGITAARKANLATRNTRHFDGLGLTLVDPWSS